MATPPFRMVAARPVAASAALEPLYNNLVSLMLLNSAEQSTPATIWVARTPAGGPEGRRHNRLIWVTETAAALSDDDRQRNRLVFEALGDALLVDQDALSFDEYLDALEARDPLKWRDEIVAQILRRVPPPHVGEATALLADADAFIDAVAAGYPGDRVDRELQLEAHRLLNDPPAMQRVIVDHLRTMWSAHLAAEWKRNVGLLSGMTTVLRRRGLPSGSAAEVIRACVGRDLPGDSSLLLAGVEQLVFVPSAHVGLYASRFGSDDTLWVFVNSTVIQDWSMRQGPVARSELLARLNTLADETRLRILELLARHDELQAQEIIARLELTQSSASRHLNQLRSLGFVVERRGEGATKLYQLNRPQFDWTFRAVEQLLAGESQGVAEAQFTEQSDEIRNFLDRQGRVTSWPAKVRVQRLLLRYLVERFEPGRRYSEREVNALLNEWHTFDDPATLRRDMYDLRLFDRTRDGMQYWRVEESVLV
jgi:hypothetical protein